MHALPKHSGYLGLTVAAALLLGSGDAGADRKAKTSDPDVTEIKDKLTILHDGSGHYVALVEFGESDHVYYSWDSKKGKAKTFYQQRVYSAGHDTGKGTMSRSFWSPFVDGNPTVRLDKNQSWAMECGDSSTPLHKVPDAERKKILGKAKFKAPYWKRQAYALVRDEMGVYYYVDRLRDEHGGKGFRLFKGRKGKLKKQTMVDIVHDSEGDIFSTKDGALRMILSENKSTWIERNHKTKKETRTDLTVVPVRRNALLIYTELGVYNERFGTPCDDM